MFKSNVRSAAIVCGVLALVIVGSEGFRSEQSRTRAADPRNPKLQALMHKRIELLREVETQWSAAYESGRASLAQVIDAKKAVLGAELEMCATNKDRTAVLEKMLQIAVDFEAGTARQVEAGMLPTSASLAAKVSRLDVEIALERVHGQ